MILQEDKERKEEEHEKELQPMSGGWVRPEDEYKEQPSYLESNISFT